jgi:hypothetical protein
VIASFDDLVASRTVRDCVHINDERRQIATAFGGIIAVSMEKSENGMKWRRGDVRRIDSV